jgi:hypothetical protein
MRKLREAIGVHIDAEAYKYLKLEGYQNGQSITGALSSVIRAREAAEPMTFKIIKTISGNGTVYEVTVNGLGDAICSASTIEAAQADLDRFMSAHKLGLRRFKTNKEIKVVYRHAMVFLKSTKPKEAVEPRQIVFLK